MEDDRDTTETPEIAAEPHYDTINAGTILQTEHLNELAAALSDFQADVVGSGKGGSATDRRRTKSGDYYTTERSYTRLEDAWAAAREPLTRHGLSLTQWPTSEPGEVTVITRLMHSSGQWMQAQLTLAIEQDAKMNQTQKYGSAITYACRYALLAALGLPPVDDDAQSAGSSQPSKARDGRKKPRAAKASDVKALRTALELATTKDEFTKAAASVKARIDLSAPQLAELRDVASRVQSEAEWYEQDASVKGRMAAKAAQPMTDDEKAAAVAEESEA